MGTDGSAPYAGLLNVNGTLYGTTDLGGTQNDGTVFSFNPSTNKETRLHSFAGPTMYGFNADGANPQAALISFNGLLYGTTYSGGEGPTREDQGSEGGIIFSVDPSTSTEKILYTFAGNIHYPQGYNDGASPVTPLLNFNGLFYGSTESGDSDGTLYSFDPSTGQDTVIHAFGQYMSNDGGAPLAGLINVNGLLYGTTSEGSTSSTSGTIFSYNPTSGALTTLYNFTGNGTNGAASTPRGDLVYDPVSGKLYGVTQLGGANNQGTVFSFDPATNQVRTVFSFSSATGITPTSGLLLINNTLYGTTQNGGTNNDGTLFAIKITLTAPVAKDDAGRTAANTTLVIPAPGVLGNDNPGTTGTVTTTLVTGPTHGTINFHSDGSFTYVPSTNYAGQDSFTYQDTNSLGKSNIATCTLTVQFTTPVAVNDKVTSGYNSSITVAAPGVLSNDFTGGYSTTAVLVSNPTRGTLTFNSDGSFTYVPGPNYTGQDSFTYQDTDAFGTSNVATVTLALQPTAPIAVDDTDVASYNTPLVINAPGVLSNDSNGGSPTTAALVTGPSHGTLTLNSNGSFTYIPTSGYLGTDSFTYKDTNAVGTSNIATCSLTVQTRTPVANDDHGTSYYNTVLTINAPGLLGNDNTGGSPTKASVVVKPTHGNLILNGDGSFQYTPSPGFIGTDSFLYEDTNAVGTSNIASCTLSILARVPTAKNDSNNAQQNTTLTINAPGVLNNDDNGGSFPLTASLVTGTSHGTVSLSSNGGYSYTPNAGYVGNDTFTYQAVNGVGKSNIATVTVIVR